MRATADIVNLTIRRIEQRLGKTLEIPPLSPTAQKSCSYAASRTSMSTSSLPSLSQILRWLRR